MSTVIQIENLSKVYRLGEIGTGSFTRDMERWYARARGKEDPFTRIGEVPQMKSGLVSSLQQINLNIGQGEAVGVVGRNGAGKSTLLKILSRVTGPTTGSVKIKGRIASLLEVGTGFHPDLTGRENIYLNGAILGMRKSEIKRKLDQIIDFSGVEKYIDTPVKRYSSGMYVRLAFAVAAHLDSDILVVDEVLAVGDAEFQKKCLGKMGEISKGEGRTVLFVSHNMSAIRQLCNRCIYLDKGRLEFSGEVNEGLSLYYNSIKTSSAGRLRFFENRKVKSSTRITGFEVKQDPVKGCLVSVGVESSDIVKNMEIAFGINDGLGLRLATFHSRFTNQQFDLQPGNNLLTCQIENFFLKQESYSMNIFLGNKFEVIDFLEEPVEFEIAEYDFYPSGIVPDGSQGNLLAPHHWHITYPENNE